MPISERAIARWHLTDIRQMYPRVYAAESELYGPVIIKQSQDAHQLQREYDVLSQWEDVACRVYGMDKDLLLEERILPGTSLREEPDLLARLEVLISVWQKIHIHEENGVSYIHWLENACNVADLPASLREMGGQALEIGRELFEKYPERMLLHGDLHHDNLLRRQDGQYAVIDPKGVIGPGILDLPRFLLNEPVENVQTAIAWLSARLGYPEKELQKAYYLEAVLANLWLWEDRLPLCEKYLSYAADLLEMGKKRTPPEGRK